MATRIPLPADIYYDALENFLLVTSLAQLLRWQESQTPPALSMAARNDIFDYAKMLLQPASYQHQLFLQYSEQLSWTLPQPAPAVLPLPEALQGHGYSQAELQAQAHLSGGSASLREAVRQTVALLEFDAPASSYDAAASACDELSPGSLCKRTHGGYMQGHSCAQECL